MTDQPQLMVLPESPRQRATNGRKHGHAAVPGTGPEGETCGSCAFLERQKYANTYMKCRLMRVYWTQSEATDVRARDPACRRWGKRA